jgi:integrase
VTWDQAVLAWLEEHQHRRSIEEIKRVLRWLSMRLKGKPLADITDSAIRTLVKERRADAVNRRAIQRALEAGREPPKAKAPSGATINRHMAQLSAILHYAHRRGWLAAVPPISMAHEPAKRVAWITKEQARKLLTELPDHLKPIAGFALATGLRETNIRLLTWSQVDMARQVAWVHADEAKGGRDINVPLNDAAMTVLQAQAGKHKRWVFPVERWERDELGTWAQQLAPTGKVSSAAWRKACVRAGLPTLRFHDLRHTWASWHVQAGTPLPVLQELGGWASYQMVLRYSHLGVSHVAAWAGNLTGGTTPAQVAQLGTNRNGPEGPLSEGESLGWLTGLEPATTRITSGSHGHGASKIKHLRAPRRPKAA